MNAAATCYAASGLDWTRPRERRAIARAIARGSEALIYRHSDECAAILEARLTSVVGAGYGCSMRSFSALEKLSFAAELSQSAGQR